MDIMSVWPRIEKDVERACKYGYGSVTPEFIYQKVLSGQYLLWVFVKDGEIIANMTSTITQFPDAKYLQVITIGGHGWKDWIDQLLDMLYQYCDELQLDGVLAHCRDMVAQRLEDKGWERVSTIMRKTTCQEKVEAETRK